MSVFKQTDSKKTVLAKRIQLLMEDNWSQFALNSFSPRNTPSPHTTNSTHKRVYQLVNEGEYSRAMKTLLSTAQPSDIGPDEIVTLQALHPSRNEPNHPLYTEIVTEESRSNAEPYVITPQQTYRLICKSPKCVTPGIDGFRNEHKRSLAGKFQNPAEILFITLYSQVLTLVANARIPSSISILLGGAELIALKQGAKTRPIALGYSIRKDVTTYITQSDTTKYIILNHLAPIQTGIGIPNGTEKIINQVTASLQLDNNLHTLQSDNVNAFNSIERTHILSAYKTTLPNAYPFISSLMGPETLLWMSTASNNAKTIISSSGSQQGDVAGSLSYALGLQPFLLGLDDILRNNKQRRQSSY